MGYYDFDSNIIRRGTDSVKWDGPTLEHLTGTPDALPMWVADMDFQAPEEVINTLGSRAAHGVLGYPSGTAVGKALEAFHGWASIRHAWDIPEGTALFSPGLLTSIAILLNQLTEKGDEVMVQTPAYKPFYTLVKNNDRVFVENPLTYDRSSLRYTLDFEDMEKKLSSDKMKLLIFCSPHNPAGRVWDEEELSTLLQLCDRHGVQIISDEIHADMVFKPHGHIPLSRIGNTMDKPPITCMAPSKTFNIAGEHFSLTIIPDEQVRAEFAKNLQRLNLSHPGVLVLNGATAAYEHGSKWLDELLVYLQGNLDRLEEGLKGIGSMGLIRPEASFIAFIDAHKLLERAGDLPLATYIARESGVALHDGLWFGERGRGFVRINYGTQRARLEEALQRFTDAKL